MISRLLRQDRVEVPNAETVLQLGDVLHVVCTPENAEKLSVVVGDVTKEVDVRKVQSQLTSRNILVTQNEVVGKSIRELDLMSRYGVAITRINRAGLDLVAKAGSELMIGDRITVVGEESQLKKVSVELGDSLKSLNHPNILPVFIGIIVGVIVGSIPFQIPGVPAPVKLGLAGGPLLVSILLSRIGRIGPVVWYLPLSANLVLREVGITLFLACVGLKSGGKFVETLVHGDGLNWLGSGRPDHRRPADHRRPDRPLCLQVELSFPVRLAGRQHDRPAGPGLCQPDCRVGRAIHHLRERLRHCDVPAHPDRPGHRAAAAVAGSRSALACPGMIPW